MAEQWRPLDVISNHRILLFSPTWMIKETVAYG